MRRAFLTLAAAATIAAAPLSAQKAVSWPPPLPAAAQADSSGGEIEFFTSRDWKYAAGFAAATVVLAPLDRALAQSIQDSLLQGSPLLSTAATGARLLGVPGSLVISGGLYAGGRIRGDRDLAELGLHTGASVVATNTIIFALKTVAGRDRPYQNPDNPFDFAFLGGLGDEGRRSFPSGHTASAFAAAAAATTEVGRHWPRHHVLVGTVLFASAGLVGVSRMYNNKHWASDVAVGAAIGTFTGWKVVRYTQAHPNNALDRLFLGRSHDDPVPDDSAPIVIGFTIRTR
ncbi:MAG TPA: phosphatase PAP2 family protein [Longimicrobium sp.]|jgi:membrane-associated phospholipid phosphatase